eukprot:6007695-Alexandrium_andersonii.AAC.1
MKRAIAITNRCAPRPPKPSTKPARPNPKEALAGEDPGGGHPRPPCSSVDLRPRAAYCPGGA